MPYHQSKSSYVPARVYMEYTSVYNAHSSIPLYILCSLLHTLVHMYTHIHSCTLVVTHYTSFKLCSYIMILSWILLHSWTLSCVYSYGYVFITIILYSLLYTLCYLHTVSAFIYTGVLMYTHTPYCYLHDYANTFHWYCPSI